MKHRLTLAATALVAVAILTPLTLHAHRAWLLPSATVLSGTDPWVTVDAAISNDLFYFEHVPLRLDNVVVQAPDGSLVKTENASTGKYRSTFDVHLTQKGTYKIMVVNDTVTASYEEAGQLKRWRGTPDAFAKEVPAGATNLAVSKNSSRMELFVTSGKPSVAALKPTGTGLELVPVTHPNDIVTGEPATLGLWLDGKPAANVTVTAIPGGIRYRNDLNEKQYTTDAKGQFVATFTEPGMYWINANYQEGGAGRRNAQAQTTPATRVAPSAPPAAATPQASAGQAGQGQRRQQDGPVQPGYRASYTATLEVLPQ